MKTQTKRTGVKAPPRPAASGSKVIAHMKQTLVMTASTLAASAFFAVLVAEVKSFTDTVADACPTTAPYCSSLTGYYATLLIIVETGLAACGLAAFGWLFFWAFHTRYARASDWTRVLGRCFYVVGFFMSVVVAFAIYTFPTDLLLSANLGTHWSSYSERVPIWIMAALLIPTIPASMAFDASYMQTGPYTLLPSGDRTPRGKGGCVVQ